MPRRSIVSRLLAVALVLGPALALADPGAAKDVPSHHCASCDCAKATPSGAREGAAGAGVTRRPHQATQSGDYRSINNTVDGQFGP